MPDALSYWTITVHTIDGEQCVHKWPTQSLEEATIEDMSGRIGQAMAGNSSALILYEPLVIYNSAHIVRIESNVDDEHVEAVQRHMGFLR